MCVFQANVLVHFHPQDYKDVLYSQYQQPSRDKGAASSDGQTARQGDLPPRVTTSELFDSVMYAASRGDLPLLRAIVHEAVTVWHHRGDELLNMRDENGWSPLHEAIRANHVDTVAYLVSMGANTSFRGPELERQEQAEMNAREFAALFLPESETIVSYLDSVHPDASPPEL